ncbi:sigma-70 family RNA polymerase sigma factor [Luteococcus sp. H138]|uniref:sigma-70 family RNA polymerase sigma factor n=1 Tax=unclassified Luteococcus TaxID=2639923 RepID=UPI00313CB4AB
MRLDDQQLRACWDARDAGVLAQSALDGDAEAVRVTRGATRGELQELVDAGQVACQRVVASSLGLVGYTMRQAHIAPSDRDLFQEGVLGLMAAVHRFDPNRGVWSSFAYGSIRQALVTAVATEAGARQGLTAHAARDQYRYRALAATQPAGPGADGAARVAAETGAPIERVEMLLTRRASASLEGLESHVALRAHHDAGPVDSIDLRPYLRALPPTESSVLRDFYGIGRPPQPIKTIADGLDVSESTARRLLARGQNHLRDIMVHFGADSAETSTLGRTHRQSAPITNAGRPALPISR